MTVFNMDLVDDWVSFWKNYDLSILAKLFINDNKVLCFLFEKQGAFYGFEALMERARQDNSIQRDPMTLVFIEVDKSYRIAHANFDNY
jgi:hypothetical protein